MTLLILFCLPIANATQITTNTEDSSSGTFSGTYNVENGATWTVSGDYDVEDDTEITIEEGATMVVSGTMSAIAEPMLNLAETANVSVDVDYMGEQGTLRIKFAEEVRFGIDIEINNQTTANWTGTQFDWNGSLDVETIIVNITTNNILQYNNI